MIYKDNFRIIIIHLSLKVKQNSFIDTI